MRPDGLHHTKMVSAMFLTAIQRRHGLYLSVIAPTLVEKAAAGEHVTVGEYKGDFLANSNQNAIRARSVGSIILGDKEKPEVTRHLNDTSVTDICEIGGDFATMRDVHYEVKCWNPLIKSTTLGRGSWDNAQWWQCGVGGPPLRVWKHAGQGVDGSRGVQGAWPSGGRTARPLDWKGMGQRPRVWKGVGQDGYGLEVDEGAVL